VEEGAFGQLIPKPGKLDAVYAALRGKNPHLQVWKRADVPPRFHYGHNPRIAPIVLSPDPGYLVMTRSRLLAWRPNGGDHGYDNQAITMGASFIAAGPAFRHGYTSAPFQNIHVYDLLCHLLGIRPAPNDGSLDLTRVLLR
jgi:ectonucleotide pyrophosphatase/phosphodiesterase family protein 7